MTKKQRIEMLRNKWAEKIESNVAIPLIIVPRPTLPDLTPREQHWDYHEQLMKFINNEEASPNFWK